MCDKLVDAIKSETYDVIIINFANPDMVGHTGVENAAIKAIEAVDECVGKTVEAIKEVNGQMFICADHGNAEQLDRWRNRRAIYSTYNQSGTIYPGKRRSGLQIKRRRMSCRHRTDTYRIDGYEAAKKK